MVYKKMRFSHALSLATFFALFELFYWTGGGEFLYWFKYGRVFGFYEFVSLFTLLLGVVFFALFVRGLVLEVKCLVQ